MAPTLSLWFQKMPNKIILTQKLSSGFEDAAKLLSHKNILFFDFYYANFSNFGKGNIKICSPQLIGLCSRSQLFAMYFACLLNFLASLPDFLTPKIPGIVIPYHKSAANQNAVSLFLLNMHLKHHQKYSSIQCL